MVSQPQLSTHDRTTAHDASQPVREHRDDKINKKITSGVVLSVVVALLLGSVGGFVAGTHIKMGSDKTATMSPSNADGTMNGRMGGRGMGTMGSVTKVADDSITIQDNRTGSSSTYAITDDTTITEDGSSVELNDIVSGDSVMIRTDGSSDTSQASSVIVNPAMGNIQSGQQRPDDADASGTSQSM